MEKKSEISEISGIGKEIINPTNPTNPINPTCLACPVDSWVLAAVAELVDALDSKSSDGNIVRVQVSLAAQHSYKHLNI